MCGWKGGGEVQGFGVEKQGCWCSKLKARGQLNAGRGRMGGLGTGGLQENVHQHALLLKLASWQRAGREEECIIRSTIWSRSMDRLTSLGCQG